MAQNQNHIGLRDLLLPKVPEGAPHGGRPDPGGRFRSNRGIVRFPPTHANAGVSGQFKPADLVVPTTRMLAIGRLTEAGKSAARFPIMPSEVRETIRLHLTGKIDQWFFQTEGSGVVFIMNVTERAEAYELLEALPLGQAGMMAFELIPLGPLKPLAVLLGETS